MTLSWTILKIINVSLKLLNSAAGRDLLAHPVTEEGAKGVTAYLPGKDEVRGGSTET